MRNESSGLSEVPRSAAQNPLHHSPHFLLIFAKWSETERVTLAKAFLGFGAGIPAQQRLSAATACRRRVSGILTVFLSH